MIDIQRSSWISDKLEKRPSAIHGEGVFARQTIPKGEILIRWGGVVYSIEDIRNGRALQHTNVGISETELLASPLNEAPSLDDHMNHSCAPNITMLDAVTLAARDDILAGTEVVADYGMWLNDEQYRMKTACSCGTGNCRHVITGADWRLERFIEVNLGHASPFVNERIRKLKETKKMKVLVTGGSRGIGYATAKHLLRNGHDVIILAQSKENLQKAKSSLAPSSNQKLLVHQCDVGNPKKIQRSLEFAKKNEFIPNVLVLNAGIFIEGSLSSGRREDFVKTLEVDLIALFDFVQTYLADLKRQKYSRIFLIGSTASLEPYAYGPFYGIAKYGVRGLAANLRNELKNDNVGVTLITPGGTLTDLWAGEDLPPKRLLEPDDIGKLICSLLTLSEQAVVEEVIVRPMLGDMHE